MARKAQADRPMTASMGNEGTVTITRIRQAAGVAGQIQCIADVTYDYGKGETERDTFSLVGSAFGGPVVLVLPSGQQTFVANAERFGAFERDPKEWARRFVLNDN